MSIGLSAKQIRKLAKGAYTDKRIAKEGESVRASGTTWWGNGNIILFEAPPENVQPKKRPASEAITDAHTIGKYISRCETRVYPVEVLPWGYKGEKRKIVFENGKVGRVVVDAKYVASVLATKRVGKKKDPGIRWYTDSCGELLLAENGRRIALVGGIYELPDVESPEWNFRYTGELPS